MGCVIPMMMFITLAMLMANICKCQNIDSNEAQQFETDHLFQLPDINAMEFQPTDAFLLDTFLRDHNTFSNDSTQQLNQLKFKVSQDWNQEKLAMDKLIYQATINQSCNNGARRPDFLNCRYFYQCQVTAANPNGLYVRTLCTNANGGRFYNPVLQTCTEDRAGCQALNPAGGSVEILVPYNVSECMNLNVTNLDLSTGVILGPHKMSHYGAAALALFWFCLFDSQAEELCPILYEIATAAQDYAFASRVRLICSLAGGNR